MAVMYEHKLCILNTINATEQEIYICWKSLIEYIVYIIVQNIHNILLA